MKIPTEWLTERVRNAPTTYHRSVPPVAALRIRMAWQKLSRQAGEGDELWAFSSAGSTAGTRGKYSGYALVRDGKILQSEIVTRD